MTQAGFKSAGQSLSDERQQGVSDNALDQTTEPSGQALLFLSLRVRGNTNMISLLRLPDLAKELHNICSSDPGVN